MRLQTDAMVTLIALLSACASSPPRHFFTLDPVPPPNGRLATTSHVFVQLGAIHMPPVLDRKDIVREDAPNRLTISDENRWGAPLSEIVNQVLTQDLIQRLPQGTVISPNAATTQAVSVVTLDILQFQADPSDTVVLDASWSMSPPDSSVPSSPQHSVLREPAGLSNFAAQASAMSRALGRLADAIATELARGRS